MERVQEIQAEYRTYSRNDKQQLWKHLDPIGSCIYDICSTYQILTLLIIWLLSSTRYTNYIHIDSWEINKHKNKNYSYSGLSTSSVVVLIDFFRPHEILSKNHSNLQKSDRNTMDPYKNPIQTHSSLKLSQETHGISTIQFCTDTEICSFI